ncbi:MAG: hypothetical protein HYX26_02100 [Acidobacteriales bacterium]|nr:hypothetical protein [Terriglobales bacterium]
MSLAQWLENSWLQAHAATPEEFHGWLAQLDRSILDSQVSGLSAAGRFRFAYDAALIAATAALGAAGYRPDRRDSHHVRAFESTEFTLQVANDQRDLLNRFRKKRSRNLYEGDSDITDSEADAMLRLAIALRSRLEEWTKREHPRLWPA